jgi:hypothetical protein
VIGSEQAVGTHDVDTNRKEVLDRGIQQVKSNRQVRGVDKLVVSQQASTLAGSADVAGYCENSIKCLHGKRRSRAQLQLTMSFLPVPSPPLASICSAESAGVRVPSSTEGCTTR